VLLAKSSERERISHADLSHIVGWGFYELFDERGRIKQRGEFCNLVTDTGDQHYGDRAAGILGTTKTVTGATNADPSVVTTSAAHGFGVGDKVIMAGNTPAALNGSWIISAVGSTTTFTIDVGAAPGAFSSGGTAQSFTLPPVSGMRLGTGVTAVAKTGAGSFIGTVGTGTNNSKALDANFPTSSQPGGAGTLRQIQYKTTWAAGDATQNSLSEVVITLEWPLTQVAGTAANTISRALLSPVVNKGASDTLAVTWNHNLLGT
jgi:hypothetical protein